jgi:predicted neuraminidase
LRKTSVSESAKLPGWENRKTLVSVTAYHSFSGEVEASNTPTIRRLIPSCRHQLSPIALSIRPDGSAKDGELFHANGKIYAFSKMWGGKNWHRAMNLLKEKYLQSNTEFSPPSGNKLSFPFGVT